MHEQSSQSTRKTPLDTMASGIAHELNNILYPILIYANLLLKKAEPGSDDYSDLKEILDCAHRAGDLIAKIRTYSGRIESNKKTSDLRAIINEAMQSIRAAGPAGITFEGRYSGESISVFCDASQVSQVLTNLCRNSVAAIEGDGKIAITLEPTTLQGTECLDGTRLSGDHARLVVSDTGTGMNEATLSRVFDPFFTTQTEAVGLGLSTVIGIVRSHEGGIRVSSKPDIGTSFEIYLPLADDAIGEMSE